MNINTLDISHKDIEVKSIKEWMSLIYNKFCTKLSQICMLKERLTNL